MRNERLLTQEKQKTMTKKKSNTHKQRNLPNDERPVKGSNEHETHFLQISMDAKNDIRSSYVGLCGTRVTRPLSIAFLVSGFSFYEELVHRMCDDFHVYFEKL